MSHILVVEVFDRFAILQQERFFLLMLQLEIEL